MPTVEGIDKSRISLDKKLGKSSRMDYGLAHLKRTWRAEGGGIVSERPSLEKLQLMWREPALELALAYKFVPVVNARRRWVCADRDKAMFFKALFDPIFDDMLLHMLTSFVTRFAGFSFSYKLGDPAMTGWSDASQPIVFDGMRILSPETIRVDYDEDTDTFLGVKQGGDLIPAFYSLWYTHAAYRVYGNLYGWSDIEPAARPWFSKYLAYALFDRHIEDRVIPPLEVGYPSQLPDGQTRVVDPDTEEEMGLGDLARAMGEDIRSGEVIAVPTDRWQNPATGEQTGDPLWHVLFHPAADAIDSLERVFRVTDSEMFRSVHVPPSILLRMGEGWQSGRSVDNLVQVLFDASAMDVREVDYHVNILAARLDGWNYPVDSPPCRMKTIGLSTKDQEALRQLATVLANRPGGGGLDEVIDGPRFWEELGVPVREEDYPQAEVGGEGLQAAVDRSEPEPGERVIAKFDGFPALVRDEIEAANKGLKAFYLGVLDRKIVAVESITDDEWANAETVILSAGRRLLYAPSDLMALETQMTQVQRLVFYRSMWDATDAGEMADRLHADGIKVAGASLGDLGEKLWGEEFDRVIDLTDPGLLAEVRATAWSTATQVTLTRNFEMAKQILKIGRDVPTANRYVYAARLRVWDAARSVWKSAQVVLDQAVRTIEGTVSRFLNRNKEIMGQFVVIPDTWALPECKFDCRGFILGGPYDLSEWSSVGPFPLHPNCPHRKDLVGDAMGNLPDQGEAWLG